MEEVKKWKPEIGEVYYIPMPYSRAMYDFDSWDNYPIDNRRLHEGIVCKTKEEAIAKAKLMLKALKEVGGE